MFALSPNSFLQSSFPFSTKPKFQKSQISASYTSTESKTSNFMTMSSSSSFYDVLGIPMTASCHEIKSAYRKLARVCHPDVVSTNQKETSTNEFMKIHAAYSTLSDPNKRASYDRDLFGSSLSSAAAAVSMAGFSGGYSRRNWETDQCW